MMVEEEGEELVVMLVALESVVGSCCCCYWDTSCSLEVDDYRWVGMEMEDALDVVAVVEVHCWDVDNPSCVVVGNADAAVEDENFVAYDTERTHRDCCCYCNNYLLHRFFRCHHYNSELRNGCLDCCFLCHHRLNHCCCCCYCCHWCCVVD